METYQTNDVLDPNKPKALPGMLNVLTILTFIGCGLGYLGACWGYISSANPDEQIAKIREAQDKLGEGGVMGKMMEGSIEIIQKSAENRYLLLISGLVFTTLCLIGAIRMRKLRKSGYYMYIIGELAPIILMAGLLGGSFAASMQLIFGAVFAVLFVILYSTQLKHLTNR